MDGKNPAPVGRSFSLFFRVSTCFNHHSTIINHHQPIINHPRWCRNSSIHRILGSHRFYLLRLCCMWWMICRWLGEISPTRFCFFHEWRYEKTGISWNIMEINMEYITFYTGKMLFCPVDFNVFNVLHAFQSGPYHDKMAWLWTPARYPNHGTGCKWTQSQSWYKWSGYVRVHLGKC